VEVYSAQWAANFERLANAAIPGREGLYRLCRASFLKLPDDARILVVGCGTGEDLIPLARALPRASFVGIEPAEPMLDLCDRRVLAEGLKGRVTLHPITLEELKGDERFHGATSILVSQHIESDAKAGEFFVKLASLLEPGGRLYTADLHIGAGQDRDLMLALWREQALMSGIESSIVKGMMTRFRADIGPRDEATLRGFLEAAGFVDIIKPFSSLIYGSWSARKPA
jgi:tRNA (cmo5U34)-methyltransferase